MQHARPEGELQREGECGPIHGAPTLAVPAPRSRCSRARRAPRARGRKRRSLRDGAGALDQRHAVVDRLVPVLGDDRRRDLRRQLAETASDCAMRPASAAPEATNCAAWPTFSPMHEARLDARPTGRFLQGLARGAAIGRDAPDWRWRSASPCRRRAPPSRPFELAVDGTGEPFGATRLELPARKDDRRAVGACRRLQAS